MTVTPPDVSIYNCSFQKITGNYSRTIVCGDIHGCYDEMMTLLEKTGFSDDDIFVCVGDMIDRGPSSWKVAEFFRTTSNAYSVLGNHERRVAGVVRGTSRAAWTQEQTLSFLDPDLRADWTAWFDSLPAVIETKHAIIAHAQFDPGENIEHQNHHVTSGVMGSGVKIELDHKGIPSWFHVMRFSKPVCIGHIHYDRVELVPNQLYTLDDDCCFGGQLTAVIFPSGEVVSIPAQMNYFEVSKKEWFDELFKRLPPSEFKVDDAIEMLEEEDELSSNKVYIRNKLSNYIESLSIENKTALWRSELLNRFGPVPEPGAERGIFFIQLKGCFAAKQSGNFAADLVGRQVFNIAYFQIFLRMKKLGDIEIFLNQFALQLTEIRSKLE